MAETESSGLPTPLPNANDAARLINEAFEPNMSAITGPSPNGAKPVSSIEIVSSPVNQPGVQQLGALHLNEVITYKDHSVDVIGYFPPPSSASTLSESAPLYANRVSASSFEKLPANIKRDVEDGRERYKLEVQARPNQSLSQLAHAQDRQWGSYNEKPLPDDGIGEDYHDSNGAMNASFAAVGRHDVSTTLVRDLSSFNEHQLQQPLAYAPGLSPDRIEALEA
jgi:hypothetical protein